MKTVILSFSLLAVIGGLFAFKSFDRQRSRRGFLFHSGPVGVTYIIIDKSNYQLQVYDDEGWYATYPVVFGNNDLGDKMMAGDRETPEGTFRIISKRPHEKWHEMMMLDYPNAESWRKFNRRKAEGLIPKTAGIGGGIAIHGTWPNDNIVVDDYTNWTNGCISLKNEDIDELDQYIPVGTKVIIRR